MSLAFTLAQESNRFMELRRRLIEIDPEIDETTLLDTLEGATDLHEAIGEVVRSALEDEAVLKGLKGRLEDLKVRLERIRHRLEKKREVALAVMEEAGIENTHRARLHRVAESFSSGCSYYLRRRYPGVVLDPPSP